MIIIIFFFLWVSFLKNQWMSRKEGGLKRRLEVVAPGFSLSVRNSYHSLPVTFYYYDDSSFHCARDVEEMVYSEHILLT